MTDTASSESTVSEISTLLGEGCEFEGKLTFEGNLRIDGVVKGQIFSKDILIIGEGARVEAEIEVGEIIIQGHVIGNIRAKQSIELFAPGHVQGDLSTPTLLIEKGAVFEGRSFMGELDSTDAKAESAGTSKAASKKPSGK